MFLNILCDKIGSMHKAFLLLPKYDGFKEKHLLFELQTELFSFLSPQGTPFLLGWLTNKLLRIGYLADIFLKMNQAGLSRRGKQKYLLPVIKLKLSSKT